MDINKNCHLFLRDLYSYDIQSCHYTILENIGADLSKIPKEEKETRNIKIGLLMKDNPKLIHVLRSVTNSTINEYILRNNIKEDDIILRQYDGIITTKLLRETTNRYIPLELRKSFQHMIISIDRNMYIAFDGVKTSVKGVPNNYEEMNGIYNRIAKINYINKSSIFSSLQKIKDDIFTEKNPILFAIPNNDSYIVYLKKYGESKISESIINVMDIDDIDKERYFTFFILPFFKSIVKEFSK